MVNIRVAFKYLKGVTPDHMRQRKVKPVFKYVGTHIMFDKKKDRKFTRKARIVSGGHKMEHPQSTTYSSVVTRDIVILAFIIAGLNNLDILACNIYNAYINTPCSGKQWSKSGSEFVGEKGYVFLIVRALYGLKSSGSAWRSKLAEKLNSMYYRSTESDPDVSIDRATTENFNAYYKYMLIYVDDVLQLAKDTKEDMLKLNQVY